MGAYILSDFNYIFLVIFIVFYRSTSLRQIGNLKSWSFITDSLKSTGPELILPWLVRDSSPCISPLLSQSFPLTLHRHSPTLNNLSLHFATVLLSDFSLSSYCQASWQNKPHRLFSSPLAPFMPAIKPQQSGLCPPNTAPTKATREVHVAQSIVAPPILALSDL